MSKRNLELVANCCESMVHRARLVIILSNFPDGFEIVFVSIH